MKLSSRFSFSKPKISIPAVAKKPFYISAATTILISIFSIGYYIAAQPELPIFYSLAQASQQLAPKIWIFIFPGLSLLINIAHAVIIGLMKDYEQIILRLFSIFTVVIQILILTALVRIILITW